MCRSHTSHSPKLRLSSLILLADDGVDIVAVVAALGDIIENLLLVGIDPWEGLEGPFAPLDSGPAGNEAVVHLEVAEVRPSPG